MHRPEPSGPIRTWLSTFPALLVLLLTVVQGTSEILQSRMLALGEASWPGYAELRYDPPMPECNVDDFTADKAGAPAAGGADDDLLDDLFPDEPREAPADDATQGKPDDNLLDDLFDDDGAGEADGDDLLDDLFGEGDDAKAPDASTLAALAKARERCQGAHDRYAELQAMLTPVLRSFRAVDITLASITAFGALSLRPGLVFLLLLCGATATTLRTHISLRPVKTRLDNQVSAIGQIAVLSLATASTLAHYDAIVTSGIERELPWMPLLWGAGCALMAGVAMMQLFRPDPDLEEGGSLGQAVLTGPLYVTMGLIAATWFFLFEDHPSGLSIFLNKLTEQAGLYIQVGLYVWAGMLLKNTFMASRFFDVLRPWRMPPELLAAVVVVLAALPTAYSGASGIFVIAAGAIIYDELRKAGARNQLALAATAMSGSMGVVLAPCLLVVIVAALNKQVTTSMLFGAGRWVFLLSAALFIGMLFITRRNPITVAPASEAGPASLAAMRKLVPYFVVSIAVLGFYAGVLDAWVNEHNAPKILLVVLLAILVWEGRGQEGDGATLKRMSSATTETTSHIGALLLLMAFSIAFGGVVERAEVMNVLPEHLGSPMATMGALTVMLVFIGMLMDPYGAVILVSATIAQVAYRNGVDPLHFWMVVLVAFELGYLTPPVALNHLLTRAVVGDDADVDDLPPDAGFWLRHERLLLPVTVMGTALLIVAYVPLLLGWSSAS